MDYYHMMQGRARHQELIDEAQREARFQKLGIIAPGILSRMATAIGALFARRGEAQAKQTRAARRLATK